MDLAGEAVGVGVLGGFGDDALDCGDAPVVEERGQDGGDRALDVADLDSAGVEDLDGAGVVRV